ncbi:MAG TPA: hypothetical protein PLW14_13020 [Chlorobiota bacterium]|nr:hypothetical protein [Chlorobiota bacterium]
MIKVDWDIEISGRDLTIDDIRKHVGELTIIEFRKRGDTKDWGARSVVEEGYIWLRGQVEEIVQFCETVTSIGIRKYLPLDLRLLVSIYHTEDYRLVVDSSILRRLADLDMWLGVSFVDMTSSMNLDVES